MSESWDDYAIGWETNNGVIQYADLAYQSLCEHCDPLGLSILDFGCGTGLLTERLAKKANHIVALDTSSEMIAVLQGKKLANVDTLTEELSTAIAHANPLLQSPFDLVVASSVCAFLDDYPEAIRQLSSLLKPSGILMQWDWLRTADKSDFGFTEFQVQSAFSNAALETLSIAQAFSVGDEDNQMPVLMGVARHP